MLIQVNTRFRMALTWIYMKWSMNQARVYNLRFSDFGLNSYSMLHAIFDELVSIFIPKFLLDRRRILSLVNFGTSFSLIGSIELEI